MRAEVFLFLLLVLMFSGVANSAEIPNVDSTPKPLTIRESVQLGLKQNPGVQEALERVREGADLSRLAIAKALPTASGSLAWHRQKDTAVNSSAKFGGDSYNFYSGSVEFSQTLLKRGYISTLFAGGEEKGLREIDLDIARRNLTFSIVQSFYKVLLFSKKFETLKRAEGVHRQSLETAQYRYKIGRGQLLDVLQVKTQIALLVPKIEKAQNDMKSAAAELSLALGNQEFKRLEVIGKLDPPSLKIVESQTKNLRAEVLELRRVQLQESQFGHTMAVNLSKHWPELSVNGNISRQGYKKSDLTNDSANLWSIGLKLDVPLFSGLGYFFEKGGLESQELQLKYQEQRIRNQFSSDRVKTMQDLKSAEAVIDSSKAALDLADQSVKEAKRQYKLSAIDYVQFLTTEQNLIDAEQALDQARYDYLNLLTKFFNAFGYPPEALIDSLES